MIHSPGTENIFIEQSLADAAASRAVADGDRTNAEFPHLQPVPKVTNGTIEGAQAGTPALARQDLLPVDDNNRSVLHVEEQPLPPQENIVRTLGTAANQIDNPGSFNTGRRG